MMFRCPLCAFQTLLTRPCIAFICALAIDELLVTSGLEIRTTTSVNWAESCPDSRSWSRNYRSGGDVCWMYRVKDAEPGDSRELTVFTEKDSGGCVNYRSSRPALLVSSTSWTGQFIEFETWDLRQRESWLQCDFVIADYSTCTMSGNDASLVTLTQYAWETCSR